MSLQELLELLQYRITESGKFEEEGYTDCWYYSYTNKMVECFAIFNIDTRELYEVRLFDFMLDISYDIINPRYDSVYNSIDDTSSRRIDLTENVGEFKTLVQRMLELN